MEMQQAIHRLRELNDTLSASASNTVLSFAEAMLLSQFYRDCKDTNALVAEAETLAEGDAVGLHGLAISLLSEAERYLSLDKSAMYGTDYEALFESHMQPFKEEFDKAKAIATHLWKEYSDKSNRLDFLPLESDEYKALECECDKTKADYDKAHAEADTLYNRYVRERDRCFCLWCFKPVFMDVLALRLKGIAESIIADLARLKEVKP